MQWGSLCVLLLFCCCLASAQLNISDVITENGYPLQVHEVQTPDGFILQLFRVPFGRNATKAKRGPVLLQHGLGSCAADWFLNEPYESLGFVLADEGYDVWIGNNRGNGYSMKHVRYDPSQPEFWYWTWDDMAKYDLPTEINYVLSVTRAPSLSYIGISQGTCQAFAAFSEDADLASKVNIFIALAPVAYVANQQSLMVSLLAELDAATILEILGDREFALSEAIRILMPGFCGIEPKLCEYGMSVLLGPSVNLNESRLGFYSQYEIVPTSIWNMIHWSQGASHDVFQHMDWGIEENIKRYNQSTPPPYKLSAIPRTLNIALFTGGQDYLADAKDVNRLVSELPIKPVKIWNQPTYSHIDYVISTKAWYDDYPTLLALLDGHQPNSIRK